MKLFKKGDIVKVYSLQSFHGGGFINGTQGIVYQDQLEENDSVLVSVERKNEKGKDSIDHSYEVYAEQLRLVKKVEDIPKNLITKLHLLLDEIKEDNYKYKKGDKS